MARKNKKEQEKTYARKLMGRWQRQVPLVRSVAAWRNAFELPDLREFTLVSQYTAFRLVCEALNVKEIPAWEIWMKIIKSVMVPLGHAVIIPVIEPTRYDLLIGAIDEDYNARALYAIQRKALPLYAYWLKNMSPKAEPKLLDFIKTVENAQPEDVERAFEAVYEHYWLELPRNEEIAEDIDLPDEIVVRIYSPNIRPQDVLIKTMRVTPNLNYALIEAMAEGAKPIREE